MKHFGAISYLGFVSSLAAFAGCAQTQTPPPAYPRSQSALCDHLGLESAQTPQHSNRDATSLFAVYTFNEPNVPPAKQHVSFKVQSDRTRMYEPEGNLEATPRSVCNPEISALD